MILIITAMESEAEHIISKYKLKRISDTLYGDNTILLAVSGVGKIHATMQLTSALIQYPSISKVINIGVVGALDPILRRNTVVTVSKAHEHDGYLPDFIRESDVYLPIDMTPAPIEGMPICTVMTGDQFIETEEKKDELHSLGGDICDMECYAYARVCNEYNVTFYAIKKVIDERNETSKEYSEHLDSTVSDLPEALDKLIP